jgi:UDP-glucose 4-epimerase
VNILVTGGAGFIASHIVDAYLQGGHRVSIIDNLSTGKRVNVNPGATFYELNICDVGAVGEIFQRERFDVVNHHAAQIDVRRSVEDPMYDASINIVGGVGLLELCVKTGVKKFIFSSTGGAIYGEQDYFPADEHHPTRPISPYGVAKLSMEHYLFYYTIVYNIDYVILRYGNVYGPRQNPEGEAGVIAIFADKFLGGKQPVINGDGRQTRDYVYVGDVVRANVSALGYEGSDVFNIGTGKETDVNQVFGELRRLIGSSAAENHGPAKKGEQQRSVLDARKAEKLLGWAPTVNIQEGLKRTVEHFKHERQRHGNSGG